MSENTNQGQGPNSRRRGDIQDGVIVEEQDIRPEPTAEPAVEPEVRSGTPVIGAEHGYVPEAEAVAPGQPGDPEAVTPTPAERVEAPQTPEAPASASVSRLGRLAQWAANSTESLNQRSEAITTSRERVPYTQRGRERFNSLRQRLGERARSWGADVAQVTRNVRQLSRAVVRFTGATIGQALDRFGAAVNSRADVLHDITKAGVEAGGRRVANAYDRTAANVQERLASDVSSRADASERRARRMEAREVGYADTAAAHREDAELHAAELTSAIQAGNVKEAVRRARSAARGHGAAARHTGTAEGIAGNRNFHTARATSRRQAAERHRASATARRARVAARNNGATSAVAAGRQRHAAGQGL